MSPVAWASWDFAQAPDIEALMKDLRSVVREVVDAGTSHVFVVERRDAEPSRWRLGGERSSVLGVSISLLLQSRPYLWQALALGRHVEIGPDPNEVAEGGTASEDLPPRSYVLLVPLSSQRRLEAILSLEVPFGKPKPSSVQLFQLQQLCQQAAAPLALLSTIRRLRDDVSTLRRENASLRHKIVTPKDDGETDERAASPEDQVDFHRFIKDQVLSNFAHDVGTPMVAIRGYSRMMLDGRAGELSEQQREYVRLIVSHASRIVGLTHSLTSPLFYEKLDLASFDIVKCWKECRKGFEEVIRDKKITIEENFPDGPCFVTADREKVGIVLERILSNALKFTEPSGVVQITCAQDNRGSVVLRFSDSGVRAAPDVLERVFHYEATTHGVHGPDGLADGLALIRDVVRAQGGRVWVSGAAVDGATFELTLVSTEKMYLEAREGDL